MGNFEVVFN